MSVFTLPCLAVSAAGILRSQLLYDRLVRAEYAEHRAAWELDDRPGGFFWWPRECRLIRSGFARSSLSRSLLTSTPDWVAGSPHLRRCLWQLRLSMLVAVASMLVLAVATWGWVIAIWAERLYRAAGGS